MIGKPWQVAGAVALGLGVAAAAVGLGVVLSSPGNTTVHDDQLPMKDRIKDAMWSVTSQGASDIVHATRLIGNEGGYATLRDATAGVREQLMTAAESGGLQAGAVVVADESGRYFGIQGDHSLMIDDSRFLAVGSHDDHRGGPVLSQNFDFTNGLYDSIPGDPVAFVTSRGEIDGIEWGY